MAESNISGHRGKNRAPGDFTRVVEQTRILERLPLADKAHPSED
jgi:hypothetical protein